MVQFSLSTNTRAIAELQAEGMIKILVMRRRHTGVFIVGRSESKLIAF